jgi:hypothetical protein
MRWRVLTTRRKRRAYDPLRGKSPVNRAPKNNAIAPGQLLDAGSPAFARRRRVLGPPFTAGDLAM